jgi:manganese/iron transport system ATP-binding protein
VKIFRKIQELREKAGVVVHLEDAPFLDVNDLSVTLNGHPALQGVSFGLQNGEQVAVVGPNGAGKSTLFKVIAGVIPATSGQVHLSGHAPHGHICIAYLPQRSEVDWDFPATVRDVVMMGRVRKLGLFHWPKAADWDFVHACLRLVNMGDLAHRQIDALSGGQQQRMFIAQALAQEAELLMMDEPLGGLDVPSQEEVFRILEELRSHHVTVMVATHDLGMASQRFDRVMLLNTSLKGFGKPEEVFTEERLRLAYGDNLQMIRTENGLILLDDSCCDG